MGNTYKIPNEWSSDIPTEEVQEYDMSKLFPIIDDVGDFTKVFYAKTRSMTVDYKAKGAISFNYKVECEYYAKDRSYKLTLKGPGTPFQHQSVSMDDCLVEISTQLSATFLDKQKGMEAVGLPYQELRKFCDDIMNDLGEEVLANRTKPLGSGYHVQYSYVDASGEHVLDVWNKETGYKYMCKNTNWHDTALNTRHNFRMYLQVDDEAVRQFNDWDLSWMG